MSSAWILEAPADRAEEVVAVHRRGLDGRVGGGARLVAGAGEELDGGVQPVARAETDAEGVFPVAEEVGLNRRVLRRIGTERLPLDEAVVAVCIEVHALRLHDAPARQVAKDTQLEGVARAQPRAGSVDVR